MLKGQRCFPGKKMLGVERRDRPAIAYSRKTLQEGRLAGQIGANEA